MDTQIANTIIDRLGGTSETARICEVKPPSVSEWRTAGIPKAQLKFLKLARPDVFEDLIEPQDVKNPEPHRRATDKEAP
ncbi:MAG: hypothetical protein A3I66_01260 [Burkholderiales bacterium RIFCSPLOWO2_02_FULL_57_36]|nr:MAG: hypothetical protein A3I66_01260 [Burkholderiales bacterium RIFCSPLOWO2_02_FULL_57_36]